ncbi:MAG TPA: uracil-DNA glycosylase [Verrucomicrobiota bacterium]|nr:uracil-DNA glycosylase [Verrucomicrobiota bacterium]
MHARDVAGFTELLEATIAHLEALKTQGVRSVNVSAGTLAGLAAKLAPDRGRNPHHVSRQLASAPASILSLPAVTPATPSGPLPAAVAARWNRSTNFPPMPVSKSVPPAVALPPLPSKLDPVAQVAALDDLRRRTLACVKCPNLVTSRNTVVFGVGDPYAQLMFVGEAPGADEDAQGEPFVGKAGELLTRIIAAMGLTRSQVYIANILKCRPDTPGQTAGNRKPTPDEMGTCLPWLQEQINLIQPGVMVALGATAVEGLLGKTIGITKLRGQWQTYRGIPLMPTYHPAYLLRNQAPAEKRKVWEDMMAVMQKLAMPISEKQKGYFLGK